MSPRIKDLVTTRGSVLFLIFGALGIAWAPAPAFLIFGIYSPQAHIKPLPRVSFSTLTL